MNGIIICTELTLLEFLPSLIFQSSPSSLSISHRLALLFKQDAHALFLISYLIIAFAFASIYFPLFPNAKSFSSVGEFKPNSIVKKVRDESKFIL